MNLPSSSPDQNEEPEKTGFDESAFLFDYEKLHAIAAPLQPPAEREADLIRPLQWSAKALAHSRALRLASLLPFAAFFGVCWLIDLPSNLGLTALILPVLAFRVCVLLVPIPRSHDPERLADHDLPFYTVLVPLYREPEIVGQLLANLSALDYPADRREVLFLLETDDRETRHTLLAHTLPDGFHLVMVPDGHPRTKPRALNFGLRRARGSLIVVYDAEDRPHPDQLRRAAEAFAQADPHLACLQAHLVITNARKHWLARIFAFEYALQFDALIPRLGLSAWPVTLGGSSNHFRRALVEDAGGWDAWNVTEDADLGIRFARLGYQVRHLDSDTLEDAPDHLRDWFMQRRRWLKGWLITALVHLSEPVAMARQIGLVQTLLIAIQSLGLVLSVLFWPLTVLTLPWLLIAGPFPAPLWFLSLLPIALSIPAILAPMFLAGRARGLWPGPGDLILLPCYFLLVSAAGWMAIYEFLTRPAGWNKTPHFPHTD